MFELNCVQFIDNYQYFLLRTTVENPIKIDKANVNKRLGDNDMLHDIDIQL